MTTWYRGVDFANRAQNVGECWLEDDGFTLTAHVGPQDRKYKRMAVDCPLGTTCGFEAGLRGDTCQDLYADGHKTRQTEQLLRVHVTAYTTNQDWRNRSPADRIAYPRKSYFNGGSHIQSSVGLVIVPELLHWLADELAQGQPASTRHAALKSARDGSGIAVEAHPRLFLCSAVERIRHGTNQPLRCAKLDSVAGYKQSSASMQVTYDLLATNAQNWTGANPRQLAVGAGGIASLTSSDHTFDAWLAALTAWAHDNNETWDWGSAGVTPAAIHTEGHILILKPLATAGREGLA